MEVAQIVESLNAEIDVLTQVRHLLAGTGNPPLSFPAKKRGTKRKPLSAEARERIAAAQRLRWKKQKAAKKTA